MTRLEFGLVNLGDNLADPVTGVEQSDAAKHLGLIEQAVAAERAGFDVFQLGEHHFNYYTVSSPAVALAAVAQHTRRIRLGTGVTLLPTRDPIVVAEEFATLDVLSGGRAEIGVGRGVFESIFAATGRPAESAGEMLSEGIELLQRLLTEEDVTWSGQWRPPLAGITIRPRSIQQPIPLWCGSTSSIELCARLGIPCMWVSVLFPFMRMTDLAKECRDAWLAAGRSAEDFQLGIGVHYHVARTSQEARRRFEPYYWHYHHCSDDIEKSHLKRRLAPVRRSRDMIDTIPVMGSPAEIVDTLGRARDALGITRVILVADMGGLPQDVVLEMTELTGEEVIPAFR
jgi:alkanesulfonate monooxygenase SsuD/methylene tetrahydromethanopterin reductase-like flavin-dependent oxidoreductase (luciferase family)